MADVKQSRIRRDIATRVTRRFTPYHFSVGKSGTGFTIIELLVVATIMIVITSIVLVNNNRFGGKVLLQNLAYDIALSLRQAQIYGIAVHSQAGDFSLAYGLHFDVNPANSKQYIFFADASANGVYNSSPVEIVGQPFSINRGYYLYKLCVTPPIGDPSCTAGTPSIDQLDITFRRPNTEACISANGNTSYTGTKCNFPYLRAKIQVASPRGDMMCILVEATGQIAVQNCT